MIVGDRIFTDVVMANRMGGPLAVWTTGVWQRENMMVRWLEKRVVDMVTRWTNDGGSAFQDTFAKPVVPQPNKETVLSRVLNIVRRK